MNNYSIQEPNLDLVNWLSAYFTRRNEPNFSLAKAVSTYLSLLQLRGLWPMSSGEANIYDVSGNSRTLTRNGTVLYGITGLAPYANFNGTTAYLSRADESGLDISGTETHVVGAYQGLTMGAWVNLSTLTGNQNIIGKRAGAGQFSYFFRSLVGVADFQVSVDGTALVGISHSTTISVSTWTFLVCRFDPSTELAIWINDDKEVNTTSIPASIFNSTAPFQISGYNGTNELLNGSVSLPFLCAAALSDAVIVNLFQQTRGLFNV